MEPKTDEIEEFLDRLNTQEEPLTGRVAELPVSVNVDRTQVFAESGSTQWLAGADGVFAPCGRTAKRLPVGVYRPAMDQYGNPILRQIPIITDKLTVLPDSASDRVLESIQTFWERKEEFRRYGQIFKRGILLYGPPGSGKTSTLQLLMKDLLMQRNGLVVLGNVPPDLLTRILGLLRRIEPDRLLITIFEDLDELCRRFSEAELLSLFDGEAQIDHCVHLATTNYPELLDARFINRPSRFDEVIRIGMPTYEARLAYFTQTGLDAGTAEEWAGQTEGLSIAHLRELLVCVKCLGRSTEETLARLRKMQRPPKQAKETRSPGFGN